MEKDLIFAIDAVAQQLPLVAFRGSQKKLSYFLEQELKLATPVYIVMHQY